MIYCYFSDNLDGMCAAAMIKCAHPTDEITFVPIPEEDGATDLPKDFFCNKYATSDVVYLLDIPFSDTSEEFAAIKANETCHTVWIDHHEDSITLLDKLLGVHKAEQICVCYEGNLTDHLHFIVDTSTCTAKLAYRYTTRPIQYPKFLIMVDVYHNFKTSFSFYEKAVDFAFGMYSVEGLQPDDPIWKELMTGGDPVLHMYVERGKMVRNVSQLCNKQMLHRAKMDTTLCGVPCLAVNHFLPIANSTIFDSVKNTNADCHYPLYVAWYWDGKKYHYSLYAGKDTAVNCHAIAKQFGGEGCLEVASFTSEKLVFDKT